MWEFCVWTLICCSVLSVFFSFAIISLLKRELVALLYLSFGYCVAVSDLCLFVMVPEVVLQSVIVAFSHHTHLLFEIDRTQLY